MLREQRYLPVENGILGMVVTEMYGHLERRDFMRQAREAGEDPVPALPGQASASHAPSAAASAL